MRPTRVLLTGAALAAAFSLASPATAFADGMPNPDPAVSAEPHEHADHHEHDGQHDPADKSDEKSDEKKSEDPKMEEHEHHHKHPHGGIHAGGGGLTASSSDMGAGLALLAGGLGLGAYVLKRRPAARGIA